MLRLRCHAQYIDDPAPIRHRVSILELFYFTGQCNLVDNNRRKEGLV